MAITFAEAFFTLSRQPLPRPSRHPLSDTPEGELEEIITWRYFHEEECKLEFTEAKFSGLDWVIIGWPPHLPHSSRTMSALEQYQVAERSDLSASKVNEVFILQALCKLNCCCPNSNLRSLKCPRVERWTDGGFSADWVEGSW
jgi:hypothetical protein